MAALDRFRPNSLQLSIALTVAASGALVAIWAGGSPAAVGLAALGGLVIGAALTAYLTWIAPESGAPGRRRR